VSGVGRALGAALLLLLGVPVSGAAQTGLATGTLTVTVVDEAGTPVSGSVVSVVSESTSSTRAGTTGAAGRLSLPLLAVGRYTVRAERSGFQPAAAVGATVSVGTASTLTLTLRVASSVRVDVDAAAPAVDAHRSAVATVIGQTQIDGLPIDRRDYTSFALLAAGVTADRAPNQGPAQSSGLVFAGQSARTNNVTVDGVDNNEDMVGGVRAVFGQDAVREFQVLVSGYSAEFGKAAGGVLNIVTRSGGNRADARAFEFFRDRSLNSRGFFDAPDAPFRQHQFGAAVGGPLRRNRTFGFASFERLAATQSNAVTIDESAAALLRGAGFPVETGSVPYAQRLTMIFGKIDHALPRATSLTVRINSAAGVDENSQPWGGIVARSRGGVRDNTDVMLAAGLTSAGRNRVVNELRGQIAYRDQIVRSLDCEGPCAGAQDGGPRVEIPGVASVGRFNTLPQPRRMVRYQILDTIGYDAGAHRMKAGLDVNHVDNRVSGLSFSFGGQYVFPTTQAFAAGTPVAYIKGYGDGEIPNTFDDVSVFAQDDWTVHPRLTVRAGVRYQKQFWPDHTYRTPGLADPFTLRSPDNQLAPRLGVAWNPARDARTTLSASYGIFFSNPLLLPMVAPEILNGERVRAAIVQGPGAVAAWRSPGHQLPPSSLSALPSLTLNVDPDFDVPYAHHTTVGVTRQIDRRTIASISGVFVKGSREVGVIDYNPTLPELGPGRRPLDVNGVAGTSSAVPQYTAWGESWYRGLLVTIDTRVTRASRLTIAYTLSKSEDLISDFLNNPAQSQGRGRNPADPRGLPIGFNPTQERGPSLHDQRHRVVANGEYEWPTKGVQIAGIFVAASGRPFNILAGADLNGDGDGAVIPGPDRARRVPSDPSSSVSRNAGRFPAESRLDLRAAKHFSLGGGRTRLQAMVDVLNVFNTTTFTDVNRVFGTGPYPSQPLPAYGQFTQAAPPRQIQLGIRITF